MRKFSIVENESIPRSTLGLACCRDLQRLDEERANTTGETVFDWSRLSTVKAKNWVGVIETQGVSIEILPKIEGLTTAGARKNLLVMLAVAGDLPVRERDIASLGVERTTLLDALILVFSERLLLELRSGIDHAYVVQEENAAFVRGKLLLREHLLRNVAHDERVFVAFDEFVSDTPLNRVLKRACQVLVGRTRSHAAEHNLRAALVAFDEVRETQIARHHFDQIQLSRNSNRFETLLEFCRIVLLDGAPSLRAGDRSTFTLLFPMERVFERFVAKAMLRHSAALGIDSTTIAVQARGVQRWLVSDASNKGRFRLAPDVVLRGTPRPRLIIDTKWKRLLSNDEDKKNGVSQADIYQMVAYATSYDCDDCVLVYPLVAGVDCKRYLLPVAPHRRAIRVEFVDLSADLAANRASLLADLRSIVGGAPVVNDPASVTCRFT